MSIHLKIEAKNTLLKYGKVCELKNKADFERLYNIFKLDAFSLSYRVRKLSKRARRNLI